MAKPSYTKDEIRKLAKDEHVQFLRLMFTDLYGTIKNVEVPISQLDKVLDNKMMFDGSSICTDRRKRYVALPGSINMVDLSVGK